jgi:hypothetical protein
VGSKSRSHRNAGSIELNYRPGFASSRLFLFVYGALDIAALARSLVRHGIYRARDAAAGGDDEAALRVTHLDQQRRR